MRRVLIVAGLAVCLGGCASGPLLENPLPLGVAQTANHENPLYIPQSKNPATYDLVFKKVQDILAAANDLTIRVARERDAHHRSMTVEFDGVHPTFRPAANTK